MHILRTEDMRIILGNLRYELKELKINVRLQRVQHYDTVKVGHVYGMMEKINLQELSDRVTKLLF